MWAQATCGKVILPSEFHFIEVCTSVGYLLKKNSHNLLSYFLLKKKKKRKETFLNMKFKKEVITFSRLLRTVH